MKQDESAGRLKRGGGVEIAAFDFDTAEREIASSLPLPGRHLLSRMAARDVQPRGRRPARRLPRAAGKDVQFRIFEQYDLAEEERPGYAELAAAHGIPSPR